MNKEKFLKLLNNSIQIKYQDSIFYHYDKNIDRQLKLNSILNQKIDINLNNKNENIFFEQNLKNETLWIDYNKIWIKIQSKYGYVKTKIMIDGWLNETTNWKRYTSYIRGSFTPRSLNETTNWKGYTSFFNVATAQSLNETTNWKGYTSNLPFDYKMY